MSDVPLTYYDLHGSPQGGTIPDKPDEIDADFLSRMPPMTEADWISHSKALRSWKLRSKKSGIASSFAESIRSGSSTPEAQMPGESVKPIRIVRMPPEPLWRCILWHLAGPAIFALCGAALYFLTRGLR